MALLQIVTYLRIPEAICTAGGFKPLQHVFYENAITPI
jgi:hypothetical protein